MCPLLPASPRFSRASRWQVIHQFRALRKPHRPAIRCRKSQRSPLPVRASCAKTSPRTAHSSRSIPALSNSAPAWNIESYLNQLPAFNPAAAPTVLNGPGSNSDVQISAVSSVGISAISLRGLGPNRTLTLIDGRRAVPVNALMVVDTNGIPSSMIKRVEIISGGASAVYGADAIGGVSNFMLRRDFEGLEIDTQYGFAEAGDNQEIRGSAIAGTKISDGKGNIVFAAEYYDRQAAFLKNRDFWTDCLGGPDRPRQLPAVRVRRERLQHAEPRRRARRRWVRSPADRTPAPANYRDPTTNAQIGSRSYAPTRAAGSSASVRFNPNGSLFLPAGPNAKPVGLSDRRPGSTPSSTSSTRVSRTRTRR